MMFTCFKKTLLKMSKSLKSLVSLFSANIIVKVLGVGSIFVLTRYLTKEELALIPNYTLISGMALVLANFGLAPVIIKTIPAMLSADNVKKAHAVTFKCITLILPMLVLISLVIFYFSEQVSYFLLDSKNYVLHFKIIAASVSFAGLRNFFGYTYWAYDLLKRESRLLVVEGVIKVILNISLVIFYGSIGLVISLALTQIVSLTYAIYDLRKILFTKQSETIYLKSLLSESLPFQLESFVLYFRAQGDQLIVTTFIGAEALAVYFIAKKVYDIVQMFSRSIDKVFTGSLAKQVKDLNKFNSKVSDIFKLNVFVFLPIIAFIIGLTPLFIELLAGDKYTDAIPTSILLTVALLIHVLNNSTYGRSVFLLKSSVGRFKLSLINSVTLLSLSFVGVKFFSIEGVAVARVIAEVVTYFAGYLFIRNQVKLEFKYSQIITVIIISIVVAVILLLSQVFSGSIFTVIIGLVIALLFFLIAINRSITTNYYSFINSYLPFCFRDPLQVIYSKLNFR